MRDGRRTNDDEQVKIELVSQWKLEAESRKLAFPFVKKGLKAC